MTDRSAVDRAFMRQALAYAVDQPVEEAGMLGIAGNAVQRLAEMPVGGVEKTEAPHGPALATKRCATLWTALRSGFTKK